MTMTTVVEIQTMHYICLRREKNVDFPGWKMFIDESNYFFTIFKFHSIGSF